MRTSLAAAAALVYLVGYSQTSAAAQSKTWVMTWFAPAMANFDERDCPSGVNPRWAVQRIENLRHLGYTEAQIRQLQKEENAGQEGYEASRIVDENRMRGRVRGQPVNAYLYPANVDDPKLKPVHGPGFAYGFHMKGSSFDGAQPALTDPETHEKNVTNQFARAVGCLPQFRGTLEHPGNNWVWVWSQLKTQRPAWLVTLQADEIGRDGPVTILIERAVEAVTVNADSSARSDVTYRVRPDKRSVNQFEGQMKNGLITLTQPGSQDMYLLYDTAILPEFRMKRVYLRMKMNPRGELEGFISGHEPWADLYYGMGSGGKDNEDANTGDLPGIFYLLKQHADADPHPGSGQNTTISITYNFTSIPALRVPPRAR